MFDCFRYYFVPKIVRFRTNIAVLHLERTGPPAKELDSPPKGTGPLGTNPRFGPLMHRFPNALQRVGRLGLFATLKIKGKEPAAEIAHSPH